MGTSLITMYERVQDEIFKKKKSLINSGCKNIIRIHLNISTGHVWSNYLFKEKKFASYLTAKSSGLNFATTRPSIPSANAVAILGSPHHLCCGLSQLFGISHNIINSQWANKK